MESSQSKQAPRLTQPVRITEQAWPEGTVPVVSAFCITYNHEKFIRDAIEGVLMQETTFPVEIFVHDDASTDRTAEIVKEYADKYPKLFWTVLQKENQWSKGNKKILWDYLAQQRGEFVALCEGDDYWTNPHKLQRQWEALDTDAGASLVFHNAWVCHGDSHKDYFMNYKLETESFTFEDLVSRGWFIATASMMFRNAPDLVPSSLQFTVGGDLIMHLSLALRGRLRYLDFVGGVYRIHDGGVAVKFRGNRDFFYDRLLPDRLWVYWIVRETMAKGRGDQELTGFLRFMAKLWCEPLTCVITLRAMPSARELEKLLVSKLRDVAPESAPAGSLDEGSMLRKAIAAGAKDAIAAGITQFATKQARKAHFVAGAIAVLKGWSGRALGGKEATKLLAKMSVWSSCATIRRMLPAGEKTT